jgi:hypothetical protein
MKKTAEEVDLTFALSYRDHDGAHYYLPTQPEARKWRGPFPNEHVMQRAMKNELGGGVIETRTTTRPVTLR